MKSRIVLPSQATLCERFEYNPDTGIIVWKDLPRDMFSEERIWLGRNARFTGKPAGGVGNGGYLRVAVDGVPIYVHRIIWKMMTGDEPPDDLDHINRDRTDNRWSNLRGTTRKQNTHNKTMHRGHKVGLKGVSFDHRNGKYYAWIWRGKRNDYLGTFSTAEAAHSAYCEAAQEHFGEFWSDGR